MKSNIKGFCLPERKKKKKKKENKKAFKMCYLACPVCIEAF